MELSTICDLLLQHELLEVLSSIRLSLQSLQSLKKTYIHTYLANTNSKVCFSFFNLNGTVIVTCKAFILLTFGHNHSPVQPVSHTETCGLSVVHENCHLSENFHCWCLYFGLHLHPCLLLKTKRPIIRSSCVNSFNYKRSIWCICYFSLWAQRKIKKKIINRRQMK